MASINTNQNDERHAALEDLRKKKHAVAALRAPFDELENAAVRIREVGRDMLDQADSLSAEATHGLESIQGQLEAANAAVEASEALFSSLEPNYAMDAEAPARVCEDGPSAATHTNSSDHDSESAGDVFDRDRNTSFESRGWEDESINNETSTPALAPALAPAPTPASTRPQAFNGAVSRPAMESLRYLLEIDTSKPKKPSRRERLAQLGIKKPSHVEAERLSNEQPMKSVGLHDSTAQGQKTTPTASPSVVEEEADGIKSITVKKSSGSNSAAHTYKKDNASRTTHQEGEHNIPPSWKYFETRPAHPAKAKRLTLHDLYAAQIYPLVSYHPERECPCHLYKICLLPEPECNGSCQKVPDPPCFDYVNFDCDDGAECEKGSHHV